MSAVQKTDYLPDAATLDLWRVAEEGDVVGLASVLPRVRDINARNEHGVTALMRAAQYGHVKMVRALLDHGADTNLKRNDKFTALALAAFFGHTEIVRVLMEHGADSHAGTRYDTSPHMWATARTFNEVVNQLEKPAPVEKPAPLKKQEVAAPAPAPITTVSASSANPVTRAVAKSAVVRTLKDPPEIWDLVHEVPRGFDARSAFVTRLKSSKTGLAFRLGALVVLLAAGVVGVMLLRGVQARNEGSAAAVTKQPAATSTERSVTTKPESSSQPTTAPASVTEPSSVSPIESTATAEQPINNPKPRWPRVRSHRSEPKLTPPVESSTTVQPVPALPTKPAPQAVQPKVNTPLSTQMISPPKNAAPKGKVIQWP